MKRAVVVAAIGTAQTLAAASSYYLPAILADPIAEGTDVSRSAVFGIFSGSLMLAAPGRRPCNRSTRRPRLAGDV